MRPVPKYNLHPFNPVLRFAHRLIPLPTDLGFIDEKSIFTVHLILFIAVRYLEGALIPACNSVVGTPEAPTGHRRNYTPIADPGCRLPHMNVRVFLNSSSKVCWLYDNQYV